MSNFKKHFLYLCILITMGSVYYIYIYKKTIDLNSNKLMHFKEAEKQFNIDKDLAKFQRYKNKLHDFYVNGDYEKRDKFYL